eukprot:NODE_88_length_21789_cov_0.534440.p4 type:complete len:461 gc:universal NODE_88_length_21789_cov_0.534440:8582-9964(+)
MMKNIKLYNLNKLLEMSFSSGLQLAQLNDYLQPATACIQPAEEQHQLSLDDCLACSGCITSAESMLVNMQTEEELLENLKGKDEIYCIISTQTVLAISKHYNTDVQETWTRLNYFVTEKIKGKVRHINDGRMLSLQLTAQEFVQKYREKMDSGKLPKGKVSDEILKQHFSGRSCPLFVTSCPGWVCYAEKTHPYLIPLLSKTKSPQQLSGILCKHADAIESSSAYVFCVMPCYDKKIEAARSSNSINGVKDVDLVLTTAEFIRLMEKLQFKFLDKESPNIATPLYRTLGQGSGGYAEFVFLYSLQNLFNIPIKSLVHDFRYEKYRISISEKKGVDLREFELFENENCVLKVIAAFGFRHIQNIVRSLKRRGECDCHFYEVMACPGGCLNGGGQVNLVGQKSKLSPNESKLWIKEMILKYQRLEETAIISKDIDIDHRHFLTEFMTIASREVNAMNVVNSW